MPLWDGNKLLRDGTSNLTVVETGDAVFMGPAPLRGLKLGVHLPADQTSMTLYIEESDTGTGSWTTVSGWPKTFIVGAKIYQYTLNHTKAYLRHRVSANTNNENWGAVVIGPVMALKDKIT